MENVDSVLLIDLGSSSLKWTFAGDDELGSVSRLSHQQKPLAPQLDRIWTDMEQPDAVWVAAVASQSIQDDLRLWIETNWSLPVEFMRTESAACGITCAYQRPEDLGVDRWAAILAAHRRHPEGVCVVDCGTAITLDVVHGDGRHLGGYILPGFELMRQSLFSITAMAVTVDDYSQEEWGNSTASCITLGGRKAVAVLVESSVERLQAAGVCDPAVILTGSSVNEITSLIEIDYEIREQLVLDGLLMYAKGKAK